MCVGRLGQHQHGLRPAGSPVLIAGGALGRSQVEKEKSFMKPKTKYTLNPCQPSAPSHCARPARLDLAPRGVKRDVADL